MSASYPARWECDVVLADGGTAHVRPARPEDAAAIEAFHGGLSDSTIHLRFFSAMRRLRSDLLERFTHPDYDHSMVLLALLGDRVIAMAMYTGREPGEADVAFVVDDAHQGRGLGTLLLEHLAAIAREHGIRRFNADTLPHNRRMLRVFRDSGAPVERRSGGGVVHVTFPIGSTPALEAAVERREHQGEARSVERLLAPSSIAVIGAGKARDNPGHALVRHLCDGGFRGPVYPIHRSEPEIAGIQAYRSVRDVPGTVDLAVLAVPARSALAAARECAERQVHGLVVIGTGFAETGAEGERAERELVDFARANGMRLIGPSSLGLVNTAPDVSMRATFVPFAPARGRIGFMSQSGALGIALLERARRLGLGVSSFVSVGNKADVSGNDLLQYWEEDPATDVIALYLESLGNPRKLSRIARRVSRRKPVIAVKSGRSSRAGGAPASHTAALADRDVAVDALFAQAGVIRVDTIDALFDTARVLAQQPLPHGRRIGIVGNSGGPGVMAADACDQAGLEAPELPEQLQARLRAELPPGAGVGNPVDALPAATPGQLAAALRLLVDASEIDAALVVYTDLRSARVEEVSAAVASVPAGKPVVACFPAGAPAPLLATDGGGGVPCFESVEAAAAALARAARYAAWRARPQGSRPQLGGIDARRARGVVAAALEAHPDGAWLGGPETADLLAAFGVPLAALRRVDSESAAARAAAELGGAVALKAADPALLHKTDVGGVELGLEGEAEVRRAYTEMRERLGARMGGALVQRMAEPGVEAIVGVVQDDAFGPLLLFGMGGIAAELIGDRAFRILPLSDLDARELVHGPKSSPLLFGYRGAPPADVAALEDILLRVGRMAEEMPEIAELDLNPVIVSEGGAAAVDAKVRVAPYAPRPELALRRLR